MLVVEAAIRTHRIPHRKRNTEKTLTADTPVAGETIHPVLIPVAHELRVPLQLPSARQQCLTEFDGLDEPLTARDDFERPVSLFEELHRMRNGARLANEVAGLA